jgi:hypothetical protein
VSPRNILVNAGFEVGDEIEMKAVKLKSHESRDLTKLGLRFGSSKPDAGGEAKAVIDLRAVLIWLAYHTGRDVPLLCDSLESQTVLWRSRVMTSHYCGRQI